jgi:hypothetical protein
MSFARIVLADRSNLTLLPRAIEVINVDAFLEVARVTNGNADFGSALARPE